MEPYLEVFETEFEDVRGGRQRAFLTNSPEYAMKRLLVAGLPRIFQICKAFRNREDTGPQAQPGVHHPRMVSRPRGLYGDHGGLRGAGRAASIAPPTAASRRATGCCCRIRA